MPPPMKVIRNSVNSEQIRTSDDLESCREYHRKFRLANLEKSREYARNYYQAHKEKLCARRRELERSNPEKYAATKRTWKAKQDPERLKSLLKERMRRFRSKEDKRAADIARSRAYKKQHKERLRIHRLPAPTAS